MASKPAKKVEKKNEGPKAKKKEKGLWTLFEKSGEVIKRKNKSCPKCGKGYFLALHKNRLTCGKCGYTEFGKSS